MDLRGFTRSQCLPFVLFLMSLCFFGKNLANPTNDAEVNEAGNNQGTPGEPWSTPPVTILSVERSPAPGGSRFSIRFTKNANVNSADLFARIYDNMLIPRELSLTEGDDGVWLAEITVDRDAPRGRIPWVYIGNNDDYSVGLKLLNFQSRSAYQDTINTPVLYTRPAMEAVYEPGTDVEVAVSSPFSQLFTDGSSYQTYMTGVDLLTNQFHFDFVDVNLFNKTERESLQDRHQQNVTILTSAHPVSGLMEVTKAEQMTGGSLLAQILVSKYIKVRPSNQTSYLPPGYLSFFQKIGYSRSDDGNQVFSCRDIATCTPVCHAVGESLSDLQVFQVMPSGRLQYTTPHQLPKLRDTFRSIYWNIKNEDGSLNEGDHIQYDCIAFDGSNQNSVSKRMEVWIAPGALN